MAEYSKDEVRQGKAQDKKLENSYHNESPWEL